MSYTPPLLSSNTRNYVGKTPFEGDKLERRALAEKLTTYLSRLNDGAVLALDAPWGEGKTWFGRNWSESLKASEYKVIYIDAFEQDYIEDPFMLITSEILNIIKDESEIIETLKKSGVEIAKALLPVGAKALLNFGGRILLGSSDMSEEIKEAIEAGTSATSELTSQWIKESLEEYTQNKIVMQEFKIQLAKYAQTQVNPIVIFIDELDRCKPNFAVNLVERIKHFFDVPNIVFVLLLNREQLEKAIKGVYGNETDASAYLGKFVNFFFKLPKLNKESYKTEQKINNFITSTMNRFKFQEDKESEVFKDALQKFAVYFELSLRDIEKCVSLYAFAYPVNNMVWMLVYLIVLKVKHASLFHSLVLNDKKAHTVARDNLRLVIQKYEESESTLNYLIEWHEYHISDFTKMGEQFKEIKLPIRPLIDKKDLFLHFAKKIDIDLED